MKAWLRSVPQAALLLFAVLATVGAARNWGEMSVGGRIGSGVFLAALFLGLFRFLRGRWNSLGTALRPIVIAAAFVGTCEYLYSRADERTDQSDSELRQAILGDWRLATRLDSATLGHDLPVGSEVVMTSTLQVSFTPGEANSEGEHLVSVISPTFGSLEGHFQSRERETWVIEDRRISFTIDPNRSQWLPEPNHEPTRKFRERFPDWPNVRDSTAITFDIQSIDARRMVLVRKDFRDRTKTRRIELVYHRVER